jgi:hypothetical protein
MAAGGRGGGGGRESEKQREREGGRGAVTCILHDSAHFIKRHFEAVDGTWLPVLAFALRNLGSAQWSLEPPPSESPPRHATFPEQIRSVPLAIYFHGQPSKFLEDTPRNRCHRNLDLIGMSMSSCHDEGGRRWLYGWP